VAGRREAEEDAALSNREARRGGGRGMRGGEAWVGGLGCTGVDRWVGLDLWVQVMNRVDLSPLYIYMNSHVSSNSNRR
jgi:hypothetical protein